jgi:glycosyltransferase involved in cell wall biosynthesis
MSKKSFWITWEKQRRNRELSKAFDIKLFELSQIDQIRNQAKKYLIGLGKTFKIYYREKPKIVFCQNPSIVLALFFVLIKMVIGVKIIVDAHNAGLFPKEGRSVVLNFIARFIQRGSDLTIVTNEELKTFVENNGGRAVVLPDKIPNLPIAAPRKLRGKNNFLFICSYAEDEPYEILFKAAESVDPNIFIYVTGNYKKKGIDNSQLPKNVILTGFIPEEEYIEMLNSVDATIVLTARENCLVCGAYESMAVEKPMILSNTNALRRYFSRGVIYTEHTMIGIQEAIGEIIKKKDQLIKEVKELKIQRNIEWEGKKQEVIKISGLESKEKLNIMHIRDSGGIYGAERVILALGRYFDRKEFAVSILCIRKANGEAEKLIDKATQLGIQVIPIDVKGRLDFETIRGIKRIIKENDVDILHSHDFKSDFYALAVSLNKGIKRVATAHGSTRDSIIKRLYLCFDECIIYRFFNKVIAVSEGVRSELRRRYISDKSIQVIQNGFDFDSIENDGGYYTHEEPICVPEGHEVFGVIGRLFPDKGHRYFLNAFSKISQKYPSINAVIVGDGPLKQEIMAQIHQLGLENRVMVCGFRSDMKSIYEVIDFLVIPSLREGLPYVLFEAMASKIPVLATKVGDIPFLVEDGETGYLIASEDSKALERGMIQMLNNSIQAKEMAERAHRLVKEKFSAERMVRNTEKVYKSLFN